MLSTTVTKIRVLALSVRLCRKITIVTIEVKDFVSDTTEHFKPKKYKIKRIYCDKFVVSENVNAS